MKISVVIPTLNSAETFEATMESLSRQTVAPHEIIVSDGMSRDATRDIAGRYHATIVDNPRVHAAAGRNRGIEASSGDWLAFTDSDCILPATWLARAQEAIAAAPELVAIGGPMVAHPPVNVVERVAGQALLDGVLCFKDQPAFLRSRSLRGALITANVFYRRDVLDAAGRFDETFENYGEDIDLYWRVLATYPDRLYYDPGLFVEHVFPRSRRRLFRKWVQYGIASSYLASRYSKGPKIDPSHYARLATSAVGVVFHRGSERELSIARLLQSSGHLWGKYRGCFTRRIINL